MFKAGTETHNPHSITALNRPSVGDYAMFGPLFAHLGRDPVPAMLMKTKAPNLFRWTERMNAVPISDGEYPGYGEDYCGQDTVPETLIAVLKIVFADWTPGLKADADCFNAWATHKKAGDVVSRSGEPQIHPNVGKVEYPWRGVTMKRRGQSMRGSLAMRDPSRMLAPAPSRARASRRSV